MKRKENISKLISFILPLFTLAIIFSFVKIFPFGNNSITIIDGNNQYIAILAYFRENILHPQNLLYSYRLNIGGQFFSVLTYYLLSPINLLSLLFPISKIPLFFELNTVFNACLTSLMTYVFLSNSKYTKQSRNGINIILSLCFSLSSYFFLYNHCEMWFNVIAFFPLLMLFLEELLDGKGSWKFGVLYTVMLLMNYYITFMITVFIAISYLIWALSVKDKKYIFNRTKVLMMTGITSFLFGSVSIIPSYLCQKMVKDQAAVHVNFDRVYSLKDLFNNLFFNIDSARGQIIQKVGVTFNRFPHVYMSFIITFILVCFFFSKLIKKKDKIFAGLLLGILFLFTWIQTLYFIWHGFTAPHGYPQRGTFIVNFVLVVIASNYAKHFDIKKENLKIPVVMTLLLIVLNYISVHNTLNLIINLLLLVVTTALLSIKREKYIGWLLPVVMLDIIFSNVVVFNKLTELSTNIESFSKGYNAMESVIKKINNEDRSFYRIGTADEMNPDDPLLYNFNGLSNYVSQQPTQLINFMSTVGYFQRINPVFRWSSYNNGSTLAMDSLMGVKYYVGNNNKYAKNIITSNNELRSISSLQNGISITNNGKNINGFKIYKNKYSLPLAFPVDKSAVEKVAFPGLPNNNPFYYQNKVFKNLFGVDDLYYYLNPSEKKVTKKCSEYTYKTSKLGIVYMYLPEKILKNLPELSVYVNGKKIGNINSNYNSLDVGKGRNSKNGIVTLGKFKKDQEIDLKLINKDYKEKSLSPIIAVENEKSVRKIVKAAQKSDVKISKVSGNSINIETTKNFNSNYLMLTIPYDKGWKVTVNGKKKTPKLLISTFMGVKVNKGVNKITLHYEVPGIKISILLFILGILISCCMLTKGKFIHKKYQLISFQLTRFISKKVGYR